MVLVLLLAAGLVGVASPTAADATTTYEIGVGRADVTGPIAGISLMGYAKFDQVGGGLLTRLWSRAFVIGDGQNKVVFVSVDSGMISQLVRMQVIKKLGDKFGGNYTDSNVLLSATHTHSGPGGFFQYLLYNIPSMGFVKETTDALVTGIVKSIERAHQNVKPGNLWLSQGTLLDANINRSPTSYLQNPKEERDKYDADVDKQMVVLKMTDAEDEPMGVISWFAVHCTSVNNTNLLVSSDNKGLAALLFENKMEPDSLPGKTKFVAAFAQANEGDVSPNTMGPKCRDTGLPCDNTTSTCNDSPEQCIAFGPGKDMYDSNRIIAEKQFNKAWDLFHSKEQKQVTGPVKFIHQFLDMSKVQITDTNKTTCLAALGHSFAAGTTDGPGILDFHQQTTIGHENTLWNVVRDILKAPSKEIMACQSPKPILLATGEMNSPYQWTPKIVNTQLFQIGNLVIVAAPGEFTTMSGRRLRNAVSETFRQEKKLNAEDDFEVVLAGLSNIYTNYITTYEEYQHQRYEGASTLFGPHTLEGYIQQFEKLAASLVKDSPLDAGPSPPDLLDKQISLVPPVIMDAAPFGKHFGDVLVDANDSYQRGSVVEVVFASGHPRNNIQLEGTFLKVEQHNDSRNGTWDVVATDANWETTFIWTRVGLISAVSKATVMWEIPASAQPGSYRIRHFGHRKNLISGVKPYEGTSRTFVVT